ncbi:hypothetical protein, partial [Vibrio parahaemolyticus]|uniref:hypothetical protein n=1 Tax=Vibrio parahaemolyticus TaxID=670 RepID=UPI001BAEA329
PLRWVVFNIHCFSIDKSCSAATFGIFEVCFILWQGLLFEGCLRAFSLRSAHSVGRHSVASLLLR